MCPDGTTVYAGSDDTRLYAVDTATGIPKWKFQSHVPYHGGVETTPAVSADGDTVVFGSDDYGEDKHLYAVDTASGDVRWQFALHGGNYVKSSPVLNVDKNYHMIEVALALVLVAAKDAAPPIPSGGIFLDSFFPKSILILILDRNVLKDRIKINPRMLFTLVELSRLPNEPQAPSEAATGSAARTATWLARKSRRST